MWHWNVVTSLTEALTANGDSNWRTRPLLLCSYNISSLFPLCLLIHLRRYLRYVRSKRNYNRRVSLPLTSQHRFTHWLWRVVELGMLSGRI